MSLTSFSQKSSSDSPVYWHNAWPFELSLSLNYVFFSSINNSVEKFIKNEKKWEYCVKIALLTLLAWDLLTRSHEQCRSSEILDHPMSNEGPNEEEEDRPPWYSRLKCVDDSPFPGGNHLTDLLISFISEWCLLSVSELSVVSAVLSVLKGVFFIKFNLMVSTVVRCPSLPENSSLTCCPDRGLPVRRKVFSRRELK